MTLTKVNEKNDALYDNLTLNIVLFQQCDNQILTKVFLTILVIKSDREQQAKHSLPIFKLMKTYINLPGLDP